MMDEFDMSYSQNGKSGALGDRVTNLKARMVEASITDGELQTFRKVAAVMEDGQGRIAGDDLIAASFIALLDRR